MIEEFHNHLQKAKMEFFMNVSVKAELQNTSEMGWITRNQLILTLNNDYYLIHLKQTDLTKVRNNIHYGVQQVNMKLYCSIVRKSLSR